jgi:hypothetical protein
MGVAIDHGHYLSLPFLGLFLCGFGYVGWVSLWQGGVGVALRRTLAASFGRRSVAVVPPPAYPVIGQRTSDSMAGEIVVPDKTVPQPASESAA